MIRYKELHSGHVIVEGFLCPLLRIEEHSRLCLLEIGLLENFQHLALERFVGVMPQGPHFLEMLLVEVRDQSLYQFPRRGID